MPNYFTKRFIPAALAGAVTLTAFAPAGAAAEGDGVQLYDADETVITAVYSYQDENGQGQQIEIGTVTNDGSEWTQLSGTFTTGATLTYGNLSVYGGSVDVDLYLDDASLTDADGKEYLNNGEMNGNSGETPWWWGATTVWDSATSSNVENSTVVTNSDVYHNAAPSLYVSGRQTETAGAMQYVNDGGETPLSPATEYDFSIWVRIAADEPESTTEPGTDDGYTETGDYIINGNMENVYQGAPAYWGATGEGVTASADTTDVAEGTASLLITGRASPADGAMQYANGTIEAGRKYKLSFMVKTAEADTVKAVLMSNYSVEVPIASMAVAADEWTEISGVFDVPEDFTGGTIKITTENTTCDLRVDDAYMPMLTDGEKAAVGKTIGNTNPLMGYDFGADPFAMEYNGRLYVYMTADAFTEEVNGEPGANSYGKIHTIKVISSEDLINWTDHGEIPVGGKVLENGAAKWASNSWAPSAVHRTIDGKEKFFLYFADNASGIGVLESDSPTGPFTDPIGEPLVNGSTPGAEGVVWMFDPAVFIDDDGQAYMYFGGGLPSESAEDTLHPKTARAIKLGDDMTSVEGEAVMIDAPGILEDSGIHKYNGTYYYSYCTNFGTDGLTDTDGSTYPSGSICYMTSDSPMGPFTYRGAVLDNMYAFFRMGGNNHHAIFEFKDNWYITYHARTLEKGMGYTDKDCRSTHINALTYNADGTIPKVTADYEGDPISGITINGAEKLEAETIAWAADISVERIDDIGNTKVTGITNGSWTSAANVDLGSGELAYISANVLGKAGGTIEIKYDDVYGEAAGTIEVEPSDTWQMLSAAIAPAEGVHDIYFVYKGAGGAELFDVDYWQLSADAPADLPTQKPDTTPTPGTTQEPVDDEQDTRYIVFSDDFTTTDELDRYTSYADNTLSDDTPSGVDYGALVHNFAEGWGADHGLRMDITDIVGGLDSFGINAKFGSYYWGTSDADLARVSMFIEITGADGAVKETVQLASLPESYGDLTFVNNHADVYLSGETDAVTAADGDKVYLCITHGSGRHDYDDITIWTRSGAQETEKAVKVYTPYLDGDSAVVTVTNTTDAAAELVIYTASYDENGTLAGVSVTETSAAAGTDRQEIKFAAKAGDAVYVWDGEQKPYRDAVTLEEQVMAASWTTAQMEFGETLVPVTPLTNSTVRQSVKLSESGERLQLTLSNQYGKEPLVIGGMRLAKPLEGSMIDASTETAVTFGGSESVTIPAGETATSDVTLFDAGADGIVTVTMHIDSAPSVITGHEVSLTTSYIRKGGTVSDISMIGSETKSQWFFISSIDVMQSSNNGVIVCFGDSITDGVGAISASQPWPAVLNSCLAADPETAHLAAVNQGIGGNMVDNYGVGDRAVWRYERDVLDLNGVEYLIILEGINDIGNYSSDGSDNNDPLYNRIIDGYKTIIDAAHEKGIKVIGGTILPFGTSGYYETNGAVKEELRQRVNAWIRQDGNFDAVIDFDELTADPENKLNMLAEYDCGDGLHPGPAGYEAMGRLAYETLAFAR